MLNFQCSMLKGMEIIPAIDIIDGKCVRLTQGDYSLKTIYNEDPLEVALQFEDAGLKRLHLVDLDGAKAGKVKHWRVLEEIAGNTSLIVDFGGGVKTETDVRDIFDSGAAYVAVGGVAIKNETELVRWVKLFGADKFLLGADVKGEMIAISGWLETTDMEVYDFIEKYAAHGVQRIFCTDVRRDGKLEGPSLSLYEKIIGRFPTLHVIASGGVSTIQDIYDLKQTGCSGVIIGKAIYEGRITLQELSTINL